MAALTAAFSSDGARVAAWSSYFAQLCERRGWTQGCADWDTPRPPADWCAWLEQAMQEEGVDAGDEASVARALRRVRQRAQARFIFRELSGRVDIEHSYAEISAFAEACLQYAYRCVQNWQGAQSWAIWGLGKLGGGELNLSSDIDLIFIAADDADLGACIRQGQTLIRLLDAYTDEGQVFRIDMRLRPWGEGSALLSTVSAMESYYEQHGRDWERYALVKARTVAGDLDLGAALLRDLRPFIYRRYRDYGAYAALRQMKALIQREEHRRGLAEDIKLGPGGIREIEFIIQLFQLLHGGIDKRLQQNSAMSALQEVARLGLLDAEQVERLRSTYRYWRRLEHILQAREDQQTQTLPAAGPLREQLAAVLGYADGAQMQAAVAARRAGVQAIFNALVQQPIEPGQVDERFSAYFQGTQTAGAEGLRAFGFSDVQTLDQRFNALLQSRSVMLLAREARERLQAFLPALLQAAQQSSAPDLAVLRLLPLVESVLRRSVYLAMLLEVPGHLQRLCAICVASPWIAEELARYPALLDEFLASPPLRQAPTRAQLRQELQETLLRLPVADLEARMEALRAFKKSQVLQIARADQEQTLTLMQVSDALTWLAEEVIEQAAIMAAAEMQERYGACGHLQEQVLILAYGKLGGLELSYASDLDLVFVHDLPADAQSEGEIRIDASTYVVRWAQKLISVLNAPMAGGRLYDVDVRLRPSGHAGLLVTRWPAYAHYQSEQAWVWEHQALVRARPLGGSAALRSRFASLRQELLMRRRDEDELAYTVAHMREKMLHEGEHRPRHSDGDQRFFIKHDPGGIVDIEFMVQYSVLAWSWRDPQLTWYTDNVRLLERLATQQFLREQDARFLHETYLAYRALQHRQALAQEPDCVDAEPWLERRAHIRQLWDALIEQRAARHLSKNGDV